MDPEDARIEAADMAGAFPDGFYCTTNQRTQVRLGGEWIDVADQEMDCGIVVDAAGRSARCVAMTDVTLGMPLVVGHAGVRVVPLERPRDTTSSGSWVERLEREAEGRQPPGGRGHDAGSRAGEKVLLVGGPGDRPHRLAGHVAGLIRDGWVQTLFAGNALATHDIEQAFYGTSLGVALEGASRSSTGTSTTFGRSTPSAASAASAGRSRRAC